MVGKERHYLMVHVNENMTYVTVDDLYQEAAEFTDISNVYKLTLFYDRFVTPKFLDVVIEPHTFDKNNSKTYWTEIEKQDKIGQKHFIFNDNVSRSGHGGNASIRDKPRAIGIATGVKNKGGFESLTRAVENAVVDPEKPSEITVKELIDLDIARLKTYMKSVQVDKGTHTFYFAFDLKLQTLGTGIFKVDTHVTDYIALKILKLGTLDTSVAQSYKNIKNLKQKQVAPKNNDNTSEMNTESDEDQILR
jgi:hypothetical protein